jgi:hypothetical protein
MPGDAFRLADLGHSCRVALDTRVARNYIVPPFARATGTGWSRRSMSIMKVRIDSSPGGDPSSYRRMEATSGESNPPALAFAGHQFERPS